MPTEAASRRRGQPHTSTAHPAQTRRPSPRGGWCKCWALVGLGEGILCSRRAVCGLQRASGGTSKEHPGLPEAPLGAPGIPAGTTRLGPSQAVVHVHPHALSCTSPPGAPP